MRGYVVLGIVGCSALAAMVGCGADFVALPSAASVGVGGSGQGGSGGNVATVTTGGGQGGDGGQGGAACDDTDVDSDGHSECDGDCDDMDPNTYPGAPEICGDGVANDCGATPDPVSACPGGIGTYVSQLIGDDNNPGTKAAPVATIAAGLANAVTLDAAGTTQPVYVAEGTYDESFDLVEGIDMLGGHECPDTSGCSWDFDPMAYVSTINNVRDNGIIVTDSITNATTFRGFTVVARSYDVANTAASTRAFSIQGAPRIRQNIIKPGVLTSCPGGNPSCSTYGIYADGAGASGDELVIRDNTFEGGDANGQVIDIDLRNGSNAEIDRNIISAGRGRWARGIVLAGGNQAAGNNTVISNNEINAGSCVATNTAFALFIGRDAAPTLDSNLINVPGGAGTIGTCPNTNPNWWSGGIESEGSNAIVQNNIIFGIEASRTTAVLAFDCEGGTCPNNQIQVFNNTLGGGAGSSTLSAALVFGGPTGQDAITADVQNNILLGGVGSEDYSVYEAMSVQGSSAHPKTFVNNNLFGGTNGDYRAWDGVTGVAGVQTGTTFVESVLNGFPNTSASGSAAVDPMLDANWRLEMGSPMIDAGSGSGGNVPQVDIDGDTRPTGSGVDIGADEYVP